VSNADDVFYRQFGVVLILICVSALAAGYLANLYGGDALEKISQSPNALIKRIAPVGTLVTAEAAKPAAPPAKAVPAKAAPAKAAAPAKPVAAAVTASAAAAPSDGVIGEKTYKVACIACHQTGVANSPKLGDNSAWATRAQQGLEVLYISAIKGKGNLMPGKGGNASLSDDEVKAAVRYMLKEAGVAAG